MILKGVQHTHYSFYSRIAFAVCLRVVLDVDDQDRVLPVILVGFSRGGLVLKSNCGRTLEQLCTRMP